MKTLSLLLALFFIGCATPQMRSPQTIDIAVTVHLYESEEALNEAYTEQGGVFSWDGKMKRLRGFTNKDGLHCVKWDFEICGHELFHVLENTGELKADGNSHFKLEKP